LASGTLFVARRGEAQAQRSGLTGEGESRNRREKAITIHIICKRNRKAQKKFTQVTSPKQQKRRREERW